MKDRNKPLHVLLKKTIFNNTFPDITEEELIEFSGLFRTENYHKNEILLLAGETWDKVFFIRHGIVRVYYTDTEGKEYNKGFFRENQILWPIAPSARINHIRFSISTIENTVLSFTTFKLFHSWLTRHNYWEKYALQYAELFLEDKFSREYEFLMCSATDRFQNLCNEFPDIANRIPDYHLASYLGITNVALSRIKNSSDFNLC